MNSTWLAVDCLMAGSPRVWQMSAVAQDEYSLAMIFHSSSIMVPALSPVPWYRGD